jgi:hypothetical protein
MSELKHRPPKEYLLPGVFWSTHLIVKLVEPMGFEPTTSSMPSRRAPNCATAPPGKNSDYFYITVLRSGSNFRVFLQLESIIWCA